MNRQVQRAGTWSALTLFAVGVLYAVVLIFGIATTGLRDPIGGWVLDVMETLTLLSAPLIVILFSAIHTSAAPEAKVFTLAAFAFAASAGALTAAVHFVGLTALQQLGRQGISWPSELYAIELLAWDLFLGLALISASPAFAASDRTLHHLLLATGGLCVLGGAGPLLGLMPLQFIGVLCYGALLPITAFLLARRFRSGLLAHDGASRTVGR